ncbi:MAG: acyl-CoA dehydrogenase family protein [Pseudobdellovibrionaceae bacterium]
MTNSEFFQDSPVLKNQFTQDPLLSRYLKKRLPDGMAQEIFPHLKELGDLAAGPMLAWADEAERNPPVHVPYDPWGRRIDEIRVAGGWKKMEELAAKHGLIAAGYERKYSEFSRLYQMSMLYLYHSSSAIFSCPLAMTDGAARAVELYGDAAMKSRAFRHLTSRDPAQFWTSGQWMTEKSGGSDVSGTSTVAKREASGGYSLWGVKWFTSATTSQMAMTLARPEGAEAGSRGLSLFYLELRNPQGQLQNIRIHRLKDKLGTKALPTAELSLEGTPAQVVGGEGQGVRKISSLFNITRIYNAICSISQMRRGIELAVEYSKIRTAFGRKLSEHPLHVQTLSDLQLEWMGCFQLVMKAVELLGKEECGKASETESALLRVLTPLAKLYCGKAVVSVSSEVLECFGGAGYVEDTGLPKLLRDAQVLAIWEGTTNVLSLDMLRAFEKEKSFEAIQKDLITRLKGLRNPEAQKILTEALNHLGFEFESALKAGPEALSGNARGFAMTLTRIYIGSLLSEFADQTGDTKDSLAARHWLLHRNLRCDLKAIQQSLID